MQLVDIYVSVLVCNTFWFIWFKLIYIVQFFLDLYLDCSKLVE